MQQKTTPWMALTLGILGLVVGYGAVVFSMDTAVANGGSCPSKNGGCTHGDCQKQKCHGDCDNTDCPGCRKNG